MRNAILRNYLKSSPHDEHAIRNARSLSQTLQSRFDLKGFVPLRMAVQFGNYIYQLSLTCCGINCGFCPGEIKDGGPGPIICTGGGANIGGLFGF